MGQTERVVQPAIVGSIVILEVVGFVLGEGEREGKGGDEIRLATEESQGKGPDACFAPATAYTQCAQPPQTYILPNVTIS